MQVLMHALQVAAAGGAAQAQAQPPQQEVQHLPQRQLLLPLRQPL